MNFGRTKHEWISRTELGETCNLESMTYSLSLLHMVQKHAKLDNILPRDTCLLKLLEKPKKDKQ